MTRLNRYLVGGLVVLIGAVLLMQWAAPISVDWTMSLETDDHRPFGSQVPFEALQAALPQQEVRTERRSPYPLLRTDGPDSPTLAIITREYAPGGTEIKALLDYIASGHTVLLSAHSLGRQLREMLRVEFADTLAIEELALVHPGLQGRGPYPLEEAYATYFTAVDTTRATVLGTGITSSGIEHPTFVRLEHGEGTLLLHSAPLAFTNYFVLEEDNIDYLYGTAAYLPERSLVWADYYAPTRSDAGTPFRYILMNPSLRVALYVVLGMVLLVMLDGVRRRQRVVPVIEPLPNTTLQFVTTVGRLAHRHGDHEALARAMRRHFATAIHRHYGMPAEELSDSFAELLTQRSGAARDTVRALVTALRRADDPGVSWSAKDVVTLRSRLDAFYEDAGTFQHAHVYPQVAR